MTPLKGLHKMLKPNIRLNRHVKDRLSTHRAQLPHGGDLSNKQTKKVHRVSVTVRSWVKILRISNYHYLRVRCVSHER